MDDAEVSVTCPKNALMLLMGKNIEAFTKAAKIKGDSELLEMLVNSLNQLDAASFAGFNIVEP